MKAVVISFFLITFVFSQLNSLNNIINNQNNQDKPQNQNNPNPRPTPGPAQQSDEEKDRCVRKRRNICIQCQEGYQLSKSYQCIDLNLPPDFVPCEGKQNCGESQTLSSEKISEESRKTTTDKALGQEIGTLVDILSVPEVDPGRDFSTTNNQEVNIDEADLLKTDGTYIYTISNNILNIIQAYPYQNIRLVSFIKLQVEPEAIFIEGDHLALFGTNFENGQSYTYVQIYDLSNRALPSKIQQYKFEGVYFDGRKTRDGYVYLVGTLPLRPILTPWFDVGAGRQHIPYTSAFVYNENYKEPIFVNIISFDLRFPSPAKTKMITVITESVNNIYMTASHVYFAYEQELNDLDYTIIHKVFVWRTYIVPFADARLRGSINNQFNFDEYAGFILRATTTNKSGPFPSINIYCLDYFLRRMSNILFAFPNHSITSTRFVGRKVFIGTNQGPFIVGAFPSHYLPQIYGSLNLDGFSRFIFPYQQNIMLSFGRSSSDNTGLQMWLIDVSNVFAPRQLGFFELDQRFAGSKAQFEHKAFLLAARKNLIVFPVHLKKQGFNGALYLTVNPSNNPNTAWIFDAKAINHFQEGDNFRQMLVQRSLYIEQLLFTKSKCLLKIHSLSDFQQNKSIDLECGKD